MNKKKILVVDDNEEIGFLLKSTIEHSMKYEVETVSQANLALSVCRRFKPDLIFLDVVMPEMEGPEVARQLREDPIFSKIPIVFLTCAVRPEEVTATQGVIGGEIFIAKPYTNEEIMDCLAQLLP